MGLLTGLSAWLAGITGPIVARAMVALGFGTVTYTGATAALDVAIQAIQTSAGAVVGPVASILALAGLFEAMSILTGALTAGLAFASLKRFALRAGG